ncbi:hypothetical protein C9J85_12085 [Haloferax sp. wsp5]|nr:hypothetical protein C9J85_12085 [Haloferax sp. wsp5]
MSYLDGTRGLHHQGLSACAAPPASRSRATAPETPRPPPGSGTCRRSSPTDAVSAGCHRFIEHRSGPSRRRPREASPKRGRASQSESDGRRHTARTKRILDATSDAVLVSVADTVVYANPAAVDLFSAADSDELRDRPLTDLVEPTADGGVETVERVVEDDQRLARPDGCTDAGRQQRPPAHAREATGTATTAPFGRSATERTTSASVGSKRYTRPPGT